MTLNNYLCTIFLRTKNAFKISILSHSITIQTQINNKKASVISLYHIFPRLYKAKSRELSTIVTTAESPMTGTIYRLLFCPVI
ncbi:hypothetical protein BpHYR1_015969 [Brachionus plicatilis]|uniref:Uncharacterized protein n=1 Tax=Brachionus plicatilis TaxID=10195 RepID=A0A3M7T569_BRAPC|nr:hypothetical protein BpHYR1_015969 [Brachionus plicatilis]